MLLINEALKLTNCDEIDAQIKCRRELINEMCGSLYPAILNDEIQLLIEKKYSL